MPLTADEVSAGVKKEIDEAFAKCESREETEALCLALQFFADGLFYAGATPPEDANRVA